MPRVFISYAHTDADTALARNLEKWLTAADYCLRILIYLAQPPVRAAIPGLLTEYQTDPQMWQRLIARTVDPMRQSFEEFLTRTGRTAAGSGEGPSPAAGTPAANRPVGRARTSPPGTQNCGRYI